MAGTTEKQATEVMAPLALAIIITASGVAIILSLTLDTGTASFNKILITGIGLVAAMFDLVWGRFVALPQFAARGYTATNVTILAYALTTFPALLAIIAAIFVNEWYLALVFGGLAAIYWFLVRGFLAREPENGQAT